MTVIVLGATGNTGRWVVRQLLEKDILVKAIVRSKDKLESLVQPNSNLTIIEGSILEMPITELVTHMNDCDGVVSCLGHNMTMKGIFGSPHYFVTKAIEKVKEAIIITGRPGKVKVILMNTSGNRNRNLNERNSFANKVVTGLIRVLLPPHRDNEHAADYLRVKVGQENNQLAWVAIRPDGLVDADEVTAYSTHPSPIRDPIFNAGKTSRINVANFMVALMTEEDLWNTWVGQMPVIYNQEG